MTTRLFFILFTTLFLPSFSATAAIKITSISGASGYDIINSPNQIFGGTGGDVALCNSVSGFTGCNSCEPDLFACNQNRIYPSRRIQIAFQSDSINDNTTYIATVRAVSSGGTASDFVGVQSTTTNGKNSPAFIEMDWADLCNGVVAASGGFVVDCEDGPINSSITIGLIQGSVVTPGATMADSLEVKLRVDTPNPALAPDRDIIDDCASAVSPMQGICYFSMFPGDEKAYIEDDKLIPFGQFPSSGILREKYLRFYYSTIDFTDVHGLSPYIDIELNTASSSGSSVVETLSNKLGGLQNDQVYFMRIATVDEAGNVADFTSDASIAANCPVLAVGSCPFMVQPSQVLGLLPKNVNCFITSVAYGSPLEEHVQLFQKFRGDILMKSKVGRWFTHYYYKYGPYPAVFLMNNPSLKPIVRAALWPAWGVAWVSLRFGIWAGLFVSLLPLLAGILLIQISRKKSHVAQSSSV